jgi:hypothetical protein
VSSNAAGRYQTRFFAVSYSKSRDRARFACPARCSYWRLQGFLPGNLVDALDHDMLKRIIKTYLAQPFSGV